MTRHLILAAVAGALPLPGGNALAQGAAAAPAVPGPSLMPLILAVLFVLALIPVTMWVLKRLGAGAPAAAAGLRVVAQIALGARERIVVVEAGERWLLLGVTATSINRIGSVPRGSLPEPAAVAGFSALLKAARSQRNA